MPSMEKMKLGQQKAVVFLFIHPGKHPVKGKCVILQIQPFSKILSENYFYCEVFMDYNL